MKKLILVAVMALLVSTVLAGPTITLPDGVDAYWAISDATYVADAKIIFENTPAGYTFGLFDKNNIANKLEMFTSSSITGGKAAVTLDFTGPDAVFFRSIDLGAPAIVDTATFAANAFGFYLTSPQGATFYSDKLLNPGQIDHMTAATGSGLVPGSEYQLSWDGFVVNVESVSPIPEPATLLILTIGGLFLRRKK
jgi:hypothetical protein